MFKPIDKETVTILLSKSEAGEAGNRSCPLSLESSTLPLSSLKKCA